MKTSRFLVMEAFCNEIIAEIKAAKNEKELIKVIGNSMSRLRRERNSFNESGYIMNMIVSLRTTRLSEDQSAMTLENIKLAIAIFGQLRIEGKERIF